MTIYESGKESAQLDDILAGKRTIEGRLCRGKFAQYQVGDRVWLRRDYRDDYGILHDGEPRQALIEIVGIRRYSTFAEMLQGEGYKKVIPYAENIEEAAAEFNRYYSTDEQQQYGVLAIESALVDNSEAI